MQAKIMAQPLWGTSVASRRFRALSETCLEPLAREAVPEATPSKSMEKPARSRRSTHFPLANRSPSCQNNPRCLGCFPMVSAPLSKRGTLNNVDHPRLGSGDELGSGPGGPAELDQCPWHLWPAGCRAYQHQI